MQWGPLLRCTFPYSFLTVNPMPHLTNGDAIVNFSHHSYSRAPLVVSVVLRPPRDCSLRAQRRVVVEVRPWNCVVH